jgi:hypothetical protein
MPIDFVQRYRNEAGATDRPMEQGGRVTMTWTSNETSVITRPDDGCEAVFGPVLSLVIQIGPGAGAVSCSSTGLGNLRLAAMAYPQAAGLP